MLFPLAMIGFSHDKPLHLLTRVSVQEKGGKHPGLNRAAWGQQFFHTFGTQLFAKAQQSIGMNLAGVLGVFSAENT